MDVFIDDFMSSSSFMHFKIGKKINLNPYRIGIDYNPIGIGNNGLGYYFFNSKIDFELYVRNGLINSFDILLRNQENQLIIGKENSFNFRLNNCKFEELLSYLNNAAIQWRFNNILSDKSVSIIYYSKLQFILYFDFNLDVSSTLSLITISKHQ